MSELDRQVGGNHYKELKIQPIEYIMANNISWCMANVIKYATRYDKKGQAVADLDKIIHYASIQKQEILKNEEATKRTNWGWNWIRSLFSPRN